MGTVGLMSAEKDPRAPAKLNPGDLGEHKDHPKLAAIVLGRGGLGGNSRWNAVRSKQPNASYLSDSSNTISSAVKSVDPRHRLQRLSLKVARTGWFGAVDNDEIKQQLRGEIRIYQTRA